MSGKKGVYTFSAQARAGRVGEILFLEAHPALTKLGGFESDFIDEATGQKVELKSDFWTMDETPNMFFERFGNKEKGTDGGPWQARHHGSTTFCYFVVPNLTVFKFDTEKLIERLETVLPTLKPTEVQNTSYTTVGYRVPRDAVVDLAEQIRLRVRAEKA